MYTSAATTFRVEKTLRDDQEARKIYIERMKNNLSKEEFEWIGELHYLPVDTSF